MRAIKLLRELSDLGLCFENEVTIIPEELNISFKAYVGAISSTGKYKITDDVPAGVFVYGDENIIGIPDVIFRLSDKETVLFYDYIS